MYAASLVEDGIQSSTLKSYISAIHAILKADNYRWNDGCIELTTVTKACRIRNDRVYARLPISKGVLELILFELEHYFSHQPYLETLYKALFALAYYGMMRVGELTLSNHTVLAQNLHIGKNKNKILIVLYTSKTHGLESPPQEIKISGIQKNAKIKRHFCPFQLVRNFISLRGSYQTESEIFFVFRDGHSVKPSHARIVLSTMLSNLNLNAKLYSFHSFRIGRTNELFRHGVDIETIKKIGHWKSNAVYKYLRNIYKEIEF